MAEKGIIFRLRRAGKLLILRTLPPCKEIVKIVSASLDRKLTLKERVVMNLHLAACKPCERYLEQSTFLNSAVHHLDDKLKDELFTGRLSDTARENIKNILKTSSAMLLSAIPFI
jgi:hypothetical protein